MKRLTRSRSRDVRSVADRVQVNSACFGNFGCAPSLKQSSRTPEKTRNHVGAQNWQRAASADALWTISE